MAKCLYCRKEITEKNKGEYKALSWFLARSVCGPCARAYKERTQEFEEKEHSAQLQEIRAMMKKANGAQKKMIAKVARKKLKEELKLTDDEIEAELRNAGVK